MSFKTGASAAVLALTLGLTAAAAQQVSPPEAQQVSPPEVRPAMPRTPVAGQIVTQPAGTILARDLIGQTVTAPDRSKIGSISDLVLNEDGKTVEGFVIGIGGFLGIGERNVALQVDRLRIGRGDDGSIRLTADLKKDELANAPAFKSLKDIEAERRSAENPAPPAPDAGGKPTK